MALYRNGEFQTDAWTYAIDDQPTPKEGAVVVPKARYLAERDALMQRSGLLGLALRAGEDLSGLENDLARFAIVVLDIPKYSDGRLYSVARLLRERWAFSGELRARGDILRDQIAFLHRVGVDSYDIAHAGTIEALRTGAIAAVRLHYQRASRNDAIPGLRQRQGGAARSSGIA